jgi:hypothetical protein
MPLPATVSFVIWFGIITVLKQFIIDKMYAPYALLVGGAIISFTELVALLGITTGKVINVSSRLLAASTTDASPTFLVTVFRLVAASLALNYLLNFIFICIFCKYIRPLILRRQIDIFSNYLTLIIGTLTSYRVYLLSFSRLFKQPFVEVRESSVMIPINIILCVSYHLDVIMLIAGIILAINE